MDEYRSLANTLAVGAIVVTGLLVFASAYIKIGEKAIFDVYQASVQSYCFLAAIPLYFYNGLRGYNKKWFVYGSYLYYPVHIVILFIIFYLIFR